MNNMDKFDFYTGVILSRLYDEYPNPTRIELKTIIEEFTDHEVGPAPWVDPEARVAVNTMNRLEDHGVLTCKHKPNSQFLLFRQCLLTEKGLEQMHQKIENEETIGEEIMEVVKQGSKDGRVVDEFTVLQQKTGDGTLVGLSDYSRDKLDKWLRMSRTFPEDYLFTVLKGDRHKPLSRDHYRELVKKWVLYARLDPKSYSTHSLRRTKAALIYDRTRNIEVVRELLGQKTVTATSAYLNVGKKKALAIARRFEI